MMVFRISFTALAIISIYPASILMVHFVDFLNLWDPVTVIDRVNYAFLIIAVLGLILYTAGGGFILVAMLAWKKHD